MAKKTKENDIEEYARWYFEELQKEGYVEQIDREAETFLVLDDYKHLREKHYKSKENTYEEFNLAQKITYTYDLRIIWNKKAKYLFFELFDKQIPFKFGKPYFVAHLILINGSYKYVTYIDIKPHAMAARFGGDLSSFYTFPFIQKVLLHLHEIYVNKMVPINMGKHGVNSCMFAITFVPNRFLFSDTGIKERKIHFKKTTLSSFVKQRQAIIDNLLSQENKKKPPKPLELF